MAKNNDNKFTLPNKVLIIRFTALGDVAMTIPVVYSLCEEYSKTQYVMLTSGVAAKLFINKPDNLQVRVADIGGKHSSVIGLYKLFRELKKEKIDAVADMHNVLRSRILSLFFKLSGIKIYTIDKGRKEKRLLIQKDNKLKHQLQTSVSRYCNVVQNIGFDFPLIFTSLYNAVTDTSSLYENVTCAKREGEKWIGIAPFAKHAGKIYPMDKMENVVRLLQGDNRKIFLFGAGDEERTILAKWRDKYKNIVSLADKRYGFDVELPLMRDLNVMVSMDSANMHLASLVDTRVVSVWGATHPYCGFMGWQQTMDNAVQTDDMCRPCSVFGNKPCIYGDYHCLSGIKPEQIVDKVNSLLDINIE